MSEDSLFDSGLHLEADFQPLLPYFQGVEHLAKQHNLLLPAAAPSLHALLRVLLFYTFTGKGSREVVATAFATGLLRRLSHVYFLRILKRAGPFFKAWANLLMDALPKPNPFLKGWAVQVLDASCVHAPQASENNHFERIHLLWDLATGYFNHIHLPLDKKAPESLTHFPLQPHVLVLADRFYCSLRSFRHAHAAGAALLTRWNRRRLLWVDQPTPERLDWKALLKTIPLGEFREVWVRMGRRQKSARPGLRVRLIIQHVGVEYGEKELEKLRKNRQRLTKDARVLAPYLILLLSASGPPLSVSEAVNCYRMRWVGSETELRESKSVLGLDRVVGKSAALRRAWLWAHLCGELVLQLVESQCEKVELPFSEALSEVEEVPSVRASDQVSASRCYRYYLKSLGHRLVLDALMPIRLWQWPSLRRRFLSALPRQDRRKKQPRAWDAFLKSIEPGFDPIQWRITHGIGPPQS